MVLRVKIRMTWVADQVESIEEAAHSQMRRLHDQFVVVDPDGTDVHSKPLWL